METPIKRATWLNSHGSSTVDLLWQLPYYISTLPLFCWQPWTNCLPVRMFFHQTRGTIPWFIWKEQDPLREGSCYQIRWIFGKVPKGGGAVIFNPKISIADFGNFKQDFLIMKSIQNSNFRVQRMLFSTIVLYYNCITPISGNHVHAFHTIQPSYLLAYICNIKCHNKFAI